MKPSWPVSLQPDHAMALGRALAVGIADRARVRRRQGVRARCHRGGAGADRPPRSGTQFVHRRHRRPGPDAGPVRRCRAGQRKAVGALAAVPFAVKNLFDIKDLATRAGSRINRDRVPSGRDATLIERLEAAGAVLVGALNMGEYAYDFTGENMHDGPSRNPHDLTRMTGGSSGGSAGAVAGGLVPLALGSDTNGSIRVPSSFCGIFGLKPTYGRLSRARSFPFVASFDHLGPFARHVEDLALAYDAMQGPDQDDAACTERAPEFVRPSLAKGVGGLQIAIAGGYFANNVFPEAREAVSRRPGPIRHTRGRHSRGGACPRCRLYHHRNRRCLATSRSVTPTAWRFRSCGTRPAAVRCHDPGSAGRPGAEIPSLVSRPGPGAVQNVDVIIAPATPSVAPRLGQTTLVLDGIELPLRPNIGIHTQPISFIGLPVVAVPVPLDPMPIGVQIISAPWREDIALRVGYELERLGAVAAPRPRGF